MTFIYETRIIAKGADKIVKEGFTYAFDTGYFIYLIYMDIKNKLVVIKAIKNANMLIVVKPYFSAVIETTASPIYGIKYGK